MRTLATTAALALVLLAAPARAGEGVAVRQEKKPEPRPRIEVAFVLDATGSMGGLIETAKRKIWSIANEVVRAKPTPEIRVGLVAFRDRGDAFVTKVVDLDADLDRVYRELFAVKADGGGDTPESVNEALRDAVAKLSWTREDRVFKVIFLVGDAPPHVDYAGDEPYAKTCERAVRAGIVINTLQCGGSPETARVWREIARLSEGRYAPIPQEGTETLPTPFDERIAALGRELSGTLVAYGTKDARREAEGRAKAGEELARAAAPSGAGGSVAADRAALLARSGFADGADLVAAVAEGRVKVEEIPPDRLPAELRALTPEALKDLLAKRLAERAALRGKLEELEKARTAFLEEKRAETASSGRSAFDLEVAKMIRAQAGKAGFVFP